MGSPSYEHKKMALIDEITAAFDDVSRENGVSLSEAWAIDDYGSDEERAVARRQDTETRWQDVPAEDMCFGYSCLNFLDEIGFRYYIPAYVVWFLRNMDNEDPEAPSFSSNTFERLLYALGSNGSGSLDDRHLAKYRLFTPAQSRSIAHFLKFHEAREDAIRVELAHLRQKRLAKEGFSPEEIDEAWQEGERIRAKHDLPDNDARRALERYWGQFL